MSDAFVLEAKALPEGGRIIAFHGVESLSAPYLFRLHVLIPDSELALTSVLGTVATVRTSADYGGAPVRFVGIISRLAHTASEGPMSLYEIEIRPAVWRLSLSVHSRVFTNMTVPDIIEQVLTEGLAGAPIDRSGLTGSYPVREHVCQYRETDLDFISRWMEREGIYYFFDHSGEREKLMLVDDLNMHASLRDQPVRYRAAGAGDTTALEVMSRFRGAASLTTGSVSLTDYDPSKPQLAVKSDAASSELAVEKRVVHGLNVVDDHAHVTKVMAQQLASAAERYRGHGQIAGIRAGFKFELSEHKSDAFNRSYLAVSVEHHGNQTGGENSWRRLIDIPFDDIYRVDIESQRDDVQFRPPKKAPWPRIYGVENGVVDGPDSHDYAQIDDQGRYKVKVKFDESDLSGGKASTWIRMAQPHGGNPEGFHFPLRKGTEVMLSFMGGDPDQPIISGVLPNQENPSLVTSANNTQNRIVTGGKNSIDIEDLAGEESITLHTPHMDTNIHMGHPNKAGYSLDIDTDGDSNLHVVGRRDVAIDDESTVTVMKDETRSFMADTTETVVGEVNKSVGKDMITLTMNDTIGLTIGNSLGATLGNSVSQTVGNSFSQTIGNTVSEFMGSQMSRTMGLSDSITMGVSTSFFGGDNISTTMGNAVSNTMGNSISNVTGNHFKTVTGNYVTISLATNTSLTIGANSSLTLASELGVFLGVKTSLSVAGLIDISAAIKIGANAAIVIEASAAAGVKYETGTVESNTTSVKDLQVEIASLKSAIATCSAWIMSTKSAIISN